MPMHPPYSLTGNPMNVHSQAFPYDKPTYGLPLLQALRDYDRRSRIDRSQKAHEYAEGLLQKALSIGSHDEADTTEGQQAVRVQQ